MQACEFRDKYEEFKDLGAEVIGISADTEESHARFVEKFKLPLSFLSDPDKKAERP
jgi:thioredoxin-dependent peroxiredoxin